MAEASTEAAGARARALTLGATLLVWSALGLGVGAGRFLTKPPTASPLDWFESLGRSTTAQTTPAPEQTEPQPAPELSDEERVFGLTRVEMLSSDPGQGRPQADVRSYVAYSNVGYYIEYAGAQSDSLRVELLNSAGQTVSTCMHDALVGDGSRHCRFSSVAPGDYRVRVQISNYQTAVLAFHVAEDATVAVGPPPDDLDGEVITNPQWLERPQGSDFAELYPERALRAGRGGRVVLVCLVRANGRVQCSVETEDPPGYGFGAASLRASRLFRMSPQLADGMPSEGGRVRVPMTWRMAD